MLIFVSVYNCAYLCVLPATLPATFHMEKTSPQTNRFGKIPVRFIKSRDRWQLTIWADGKRKRSFYRSEKEALEKWGKHCRRIKKFGTDSASYSPEDHREFAEAKRLISGVDLRDAARFYLMHHPEDVREATVSDAVEQFIEQQQKRGLSKKHIVGLTSHTEAFAATFGHLSTPEINSNRVLKWLTDLARHQKPRTVWNYHGSLSTFFYWCVRRKLMASSPMDGIARSDLPTIPVRPKGVLSVDQSCAVMAYLNKSDELYVPWHALQLFAGIRVAELNRLTWDSIDLKTETITLVGWREDDEGNLSRVVKTGDDWVLHDLPKNLWQWLKKYKGEGRIAVPGSSTVTRLRTKEFPKLKTPVEKWPQNAMRHTFCTMMISLHGDAVKVCNWSRHTNPRQLYKSYVAKLVSRAEAKRYFSISP